MRSPHYTGEHDNEEPNSHVCAWYEQETLLPLLQKTCMTGFGRGISSSELFLSFMLHYNLFQEICDTQNFQV